MKSPVVRLTAAFLLVLFNSLAFAVSIGTVSVNPTSTLVGIAADAVFIAQITSPNVIPASVNLQSIDPQGRATVVGILHDDGLDGDAQAGDSFYSLRYTFYEQTPVTYKYRVSAAIQGKVTRDFSSLFSFNVTGTSGVGISLTQPVNLAFVNTSPTLVSGSVGNAVATVAVNGIQATLSGNQFQASIPLQEGNNTVTAVATNPNSTTSTASIQVTLDTTPPRVTVESPVNGATTTEASVTVTGIVNDLVVGTVNSQQASVKVNGNNAQVSNRTYTATAVPLQIGDNTITVTGSDQTGNNATTTVKVTREAITQPYIKLVSGNNQSGGIASQLTAPLVVQALNGTTPVPNVPVIFKIVENDGFLSPGNNKPQTIVVNTNAQGNAQANFTLGNRAGAGNNIVQAYATGYQGTALFTASGLAKAAAKINVDSGNNQFGAIKQALALPLVGVVTDLGHNRVGGVPVTFTVKQGGGTINGASTYKTTSDSDGRILAVLTLGSQPGQDNNLIEASIDGLAGAVAAFTASGKNPGSPSKTAVSGVVQDNAGNAIPGVTMRMYTTNLGKNNNGINNTQHVEVVTPVVTDTKGAFKILPAPVGFFKLMADGSTATQGGKLFPTLEYDMVTVSGQNNTVGSPIYLPELDPQAKVCVTGTTGGVLKMASSPGFSLNIAPGSATFPGGSKTGCVTVTPVNPDKVPMVPGFGQQPRYVVTIQPVGTTFNPPAAITIPNMDGLAPHAKTEMYSYDHDLAAFVAIGSGTVSADGSVIASDSGIGVMKAGWHCGGNPNTAGSAGSCPACQSCKGDQCEVTNENPGDCKKCSSGKAETDDAKNDQCCGGGSSICKDGTCKPVTVESVEGKVKGQDTGALLTGQTAEFSAAASNGSCDLEFSWDFGDSTSSTEQNPKHTYQKEGSYDVKVKAKCKKCSASEKVDTLKVSVSKLKIKELSFLDDFSIYKDEIGSITEIKDPVWKDSNSADKNERVGYVRKNVMNVTAKFEVDPIPINQIDGITIEGNVSGFGKFVKTGVSIPKNKAEILISDVKSDKLLPETTKFYNPFVIEWSHMNDGDACPKCVSDGSTSSIVYVTLNTPSDKAYYTSLHIAVTKGDVGKPEDALANSWSFFGDGSKPNNVKTWNGRPLVYYPAGTKFQGCAINAEDLLMSATGGGRCGSFGQFFQNVLAMNGIASTGIEVAPAGKEYIVEVMLIKNFSYSQAPSFPNATEYKWKFIPSSDYNEMVPIPKNSLYGDMTSNSGAPGQNSPTPSEKAHWNHAIVKTDISSLYYDPSYGLVYKDVNDFEKKAVDGYYKFFNNESFARVRKPGRPNSIQFINR